jgi:hypothetical protein
VQEIQNKICLTSETNIEPKQHMTAEVPMQTHNPRNQENESKIKSIEVLGRGS